MSKATANATLTIKISKADMLLYTNELYKDIADPELNGLNTHASNEDTHNLNARFAAVGADIDLVWDELATKVGLADIDLTSKADKAGDTFTGPVVITTSGDHLTINSVDSGRRALYSTTQGLKRWGIEVGTNEEELGNNQGSNFSFARYTDSGEFIGSPMKIDRATGTVTIEKLVLGGDLIEEPSLDIRLHPWEPTENLRRGTVWLRPDVIPV